MPEKTPTVLAVAARRAERARAGVKLEVVVRIVVVGAALYPYAI